MALQNFFWDGVTEKATLRHEAILSTVANGRGGRNQGNK
jgi:hypothetical protein